MTRLTVNDDVTIPGVVVALHVETVKTPQPTFPDRFNHSLRCWGAVAGRIEGGKWTREKQKSSSQTTCMWDWFNFVRIMHRPTWVFAQNLPLALTALGLWKLLESGEFSLHRRPDRNTIMRRARLNQNNPERAVPGLLITSGPPDAVVCYHKSGWKLIILDCRNFWENFCAVPVGNGPAQEAAVPSKDAPIANWLSYCVTQASNISCSVTSLLVWHAKQEFGRFGLSIAGTALAAFRHRFMCHNVELPDDQDVRDSEREAYYPGRVEAFWVGAWDNNRYVPVAEARDKTLFDLEAPSPPFYHLDARSFYGAIGAFCDLPVACVESSPDIADGAAPRSGRMLEYIARVDIASQSDVYPVRHSGRVLYARGHFGTVLAGPELSRAFHNGHITRWYWWKRYALEPLFQKYSLALWEERERTAREGMHAITPLCKAMLARLHGKFLQRKNKWEARPEMRAPHPWAEWTEGSATTGRYRKFRAIGWDVEEEVDAGDSPHCFPAIAAYVASYGREWLQTWINYAGKGNVLYVATDSLIVTEPGRDRLSGRGIIWNDGIGSVRIEACVTELSIKAANNLSIGPRRILAGRVQNISTNPGAPGSSEVADTLRSVIFVRNGRTVESRIQPWSEPRPEYQQRIGAGGWLEPPQVNTCYAPSLSLLSGSPSSDSLTA